MNYIYFESGTDDFVTLRTKSVNVRVSSGRDGGKVVVIAGVLDAETLTEAWAHALEPLRKARPSSLAIDVSQLSYCDGAGLGLFTGLRRMVSAGGGETKFVGVRPDQQRFLEMSVLKDPLAKQLEPPPRSGMVVQIGRGTAEILTDIGALIVFIGELSATLVWAFLHPWKIRVRDVLNVADKAGANAMPVVSLLGLLIGLILAFQTATPLQRFGAQPMIPTIVAIAVVREMGPLITAVLLAGRSGSAFAAEIGTMQVTEELNALKTLGLDPVRFLVLPRVLAALVVTPLLTVFNILMSMVGAYIVMAALGYSLSFYVDQITGCITYRDFIGGLAKSFVFAVIVAGIGCLRGMQTRSGPGAVGDSTTRAVVAGIVLTILADAVLGVVYYYLGI
ncbi:MAG TPA: ABC transporter permease [Tepidisphaeraceae bacterium]|nr:ABC transporter permease [Tepidisphaeraceae bacterium]